MTKLVKTSHPLYGIWNSMVGRCTQESQASYPNYGGRGIKVCDEWMGNFWKFVEDMGNKPTGDHTLERLDNDGDYEPSNCVWATREEQANNRRSNVVIDHDGKSLTVSQWSKELSIPVQTLFGRIRRGLTGDELFHVGDILTGNKEVVALDLTNKKILLYHGVRAMCRDMNLPRPSVLKNLRDVEIKPYRGFLFGFRDEFGKSRLDYLT